MTERSRSVLSLPLGQVAYQLLQAGHKSVKTVRTHAQARSQGGKGDPIGGIYDASPDLLLRGGWKGEQGAMPSQTMGKKIKLSCRNMHIDALAVAVINDHKQLINIAAFHHLRHIDTKKCSPPDP